MSFDNHTFAICAYKESRYLEECIKSVLNQEEQSKVIICTATPNEYISNLAEKYNIKLFVRDGQPGIQEDWNFAYSCADTKYVTITHQDDVYCKGYGKKIYEKINENKRQIILFSDYREIKNGEVIPLTINLKIKKLMLFPLRLAIFRGNKFVRRMILSLGSPICCPAVTYNKDVNGEKVFTSTMKCSLDWDTWHKLSKENGQFVFIKDELVYHRIHDESETTNSIENNVRQEEDYEMFKKFWPDFIAKRLAKAYNKSLDTNNV